MSGPLSASNEARQFLHENGDMTEYPLLILRCKIQKLPTFGCSLNKGKSRTEAIKVLAPVTISHTTQTSNDLISHIWFLHNRPLSSLSNTTMSAYALPDLFQSPSGHFSFAEEKLDDSDSIGIAVKEAKVDSALLIQTLVGKTSKQSTTSSANQRKRTRRAGGEQPASPSLSCQEALKFELSISFNGRKYTALRSLPSFEELRRDLLEEVDTDIPELPFQESVQGHSFSFLQGILQSYVPVVERWLREVTKRVSPTASPSLRSFLWEPVSRPQYLHRDSSHSSQLDRIEETESDETEEEPSF